MSKNTGNFITDLIGNSPIDVGSKLFNNFVKPVVNPTPAQDAFVYDPQKVKDDINQKETFVPPPNNIKILRSNKSLLELAPSIDSSVIPENQLKLARQFYSLKQNINDLQWTKENKPEQFSLLENAYKEVNTSLNKSTVRAEQNIPEVAMPFFNSTTGTPDQQAKFLLFTKPQTRLAINRKNFDKHLIGMGLQDKTELRKILRDGFATGNMFLELKERTSQIGRGVVSASTLLLQNGWDFGKSMIFGGKDLSASFNRYKELEPTRTQNRKLFLEQAAQKGWLSGQAEAFNEWVKGEYLKNNNEQQYVANSDELILSPEDIKSIYDYSFGDLNAAESAAVFLGENVGASLGFGFTVKTAGGIGSMINKSLNPSTYYVQMESARKAFTKNGIQPFLYSSATDFVEHQVQTELRTKSLSNFFYRLTFPNSRRTARVEAGYESVKRIEDLPKFDPLKKKLEATRQRVQKLESQPSPNAFDLKQARLDLSNAEDQLVTEMMYHNLPRRFGFALTGYSSSQVKKLVGDESLPAFIQNFVYEGIYRFTGNTSESQDLADISGAGANVFAILSKNGVPGFSQVGQLTRFLTKPVTSRLIENPSFAFAKWLHGNKLVQAIGGPSVLLDKTIMDLRIKERPDLGGIFNKEEYNADGTLAYRYRTPNAEDYNTLKRQREWYGRLNLETQDIIYDNAQQMNKSIDSAVRIIKDPDLREKLRSDLELSFAQTSQLIYFEAKAQQTASHLVNRDIEKITPDFNKSVTYFLEGQKMIAAQARIIASIEDTIARSLPDIGNAGDALVLKNIVAIRKTAMAAQENILVQQRDVLKQIHNQLSDSVNSPEFINLTPEARNDILDSLLDSKFKLLPKGAKSDTLVSGVGVLKETTMSHMADVDDVFNDAHDGMMATISNTQALMEGGKRINKDEIVRIVISSNELMKHRHQLTDTAIYKDFEGFGSVNTVDILDEVIGLEKLTSAKLAQFTVKGNLGGFHGENFQKAITQSSSDALFELFRKRVNPEGINELGQPYAKGQTEIDAEAKRSLQNLLTADTDYSRKLRAALKEEYSFRDVDFNTGNVSDIHLYDFFKNSGTAFRDYKGDSIQLEDVSMSFENLEYMYRYLRDRSFKLKGVDDTKSLDYAKAAENVNNMLLNSEGALKEITLSNGTKSTVGKEIRIKRLRHEIEVAGRKEKGTFFGDAADQMLSPHYGSRPMVTGGKRLKGGVLRGEAKLLQTAGGHDFLKIIFAKGSEERADAAKSFADGIRVEFGTTVYPSQYTDASGNLRRDIDFDEVIGVDENNIPFTIADDIREKTTYVIDPNTKEGQRAIEKARGVAQLMLQEMSQYKKVLHRIEATLDDPEKFFGSSVFSKGNAGRLSATDSEKDGFLTGAMRDEDTQGVSLFSKIQEALTIDISGSFVGRTPEYGEVDTLSGALMSGSRTTDDPEKIMLIDLDQWIKVETNIDDLLAADDKALAEYNGIIKSWNNTAEEQSTKVLRQVELEAKIQDGIFEHFDVKNGEELIASFITDIPQGEMRNIGNVTIVNQFKHQIDLYKKANPDINANEIDKVYASMLLDGIVAKGNPVPVRMASLGDSLNRTMQDPQEALLLLDTTVVKNMFASVGVDTEHYEAIRGIMSHMVVVSSYKNAAAGVGGLGTKGYTDEGLMARAFNYARGMVGGHYLAVEAGFKVMRQHDMGMLDWMLNDKDAATYLFKVMEGKEKVNKFNATNFFDQMGGWITRNLIARGERLEEYPPVSATINLITNEEEEEEN